MNLKNPKNLIPQILTVLSVISVIAYFAFNAQVNMGNRGISFGYGFLSQEASFDIGFSLIDYDGSMSYARAFLVGLLNTLLVSVIGIFSLFNLEFDLYLPWLISFVYLFCLTFFHRKIGSTYYFVWVDTSFLITGIGLLLV